MADSWNNERQGDSYAYTPLQVKAVVKNLGIDVIGETYQDLVCLCPFHGNRHTPSFNVSLYNGLFNCWNDACGESGTLIELVKRLTHRKDMEALRFISKRGGDTSEQYAELLKRMAQEPEGFVEFDSEVIIELHRGLIFSKEARDYLEQRGFSQHTLEDFYVGYSEKQKMVTVPVHSPDGLCVGLVGRSIEGKDFKNSKKLPRNRTLFNLHRAKKIGSIGIVCESTFDTMRIHQAGFPNVVGILGGSMSPENYALLDRHFDTIIIMTDYDDKESHKFRDCKRCGTKHKDDCAGHNPGRETGLKIAEALRHKEILWAVFDDKCVYPRGKKDAADLEDGEIQQCIHNATSHLLYTQRRDMV